MIDRLLTLLFRALGLLPEEPVPDPHRLLWEDRRYLNERFWAVVVDGWSAPYDQEIDR